MPDHRAEAQKYMTEFRPTHRGCSGTRSTRTSNMPGAMLPAAMTIALTHYDIGYLEQGRRNLIQAIEAGHSVTPRDAIRQMFDEQAAIRPHDMTVRNGWNAKRAVHLRFTSS